MQNVSIATRDNYNTFQEFHKAPFQEREDLNEINEEAISRFFAFQENGLFNWEFFCNELEYE